MTTIDSAAIIDRMKTAYDITTDAELGRELGVAKTTISSWRQRNAVPLGACVKAAIDRNVSLDWVIAEEARSVRPYLTMPQAAPSASPRHFQVDFEVFAISFCAVVSGASVAGSIPDLVARSRVMSIALIGDYFAMLGLLADALKAGISRDEFLTAAWRVAKTDSGYNRFKALIRSLGMSHPGGSGSTESS